MSTINLVPDASGNFQPNTIILNPGPFEHTLHLIELYRQLADQEQANLWKLSKDIPPSLNELLEDNALLRLQVQDLRIQLQKAQDEFKEFVANLSGN